MPEIAEVEIVKEGLKPLSKQKINRVEILDPKIKINGQEKLLENSHLKKIDRHGKLLLFLLEKEDKEIYLTCHLRMTGNLLLGDLGDLKKEPFDKHARVKLYFDTNYLSFSDARRFGTMEIKDENWHSNLGPDLFLLKEKSLLKSFLEKESWLKSSRAIKTFILDQTKISGIGNYLADESLWKAKISPNEKASNISAKEMQHILKEARLVAEKALQVNGLSIKDYKNPDNKEGNMQDFLQVYSHKNEPCPRCKTILLYTKIGGRGTTYCPSCQKLK